ncbi:MAG TPA: peptidoglycan DD-metalloendopeptidase family protein [Candidatus Limnocylindrales bacterium]|nr:peptidoglycan DD-metalloendopeptidase family protein [Candidatus Limnocylindrales bacterium]
MPGRKHLWVVVLFILVFLVIVPADPAFSNIPDTIRDKQRELEEVEKQRREEQGALNQRLNREASLKVELEQLGNRLQDLQQELERLNLEIGIVVKEIALAEQALVEAEELLSYREDLLRIRLRAIQQHGFVTYLEVLLDVSSFSDFLTRLHNLRIIASNDMRLLEEFQADRDNIQTWKDELELKRSNLESMRQQVAANEAEIERATADRVTILGNLQGEIALNLRAIQDLEDEAQQLDSLIRRLIAESSQFSGLTGALLWPVEPQTWISSGFGWRRDPFSGAQAWHGGVDIAPHGGAANYILAAEAGKVIFAGWKGGYGNTIMIDHGGGTVTLYAHMSSLLLEADAIVIRGQRIGRAGTTGFSTGVHLHFEVREYQKPSTRSFPRGGPDHRHNPMTYF